MKWGIIGLGKIAEKFAIALASTENSVLHAVASRDLLKAQSFSSKFNVPESHGSYEAMLDSKDIDVVYIATPHNLHFENAKACLSAGKHVLCEKPFTVRADEAEELFRLAREKNLFIMEALWTRFLPVFRHVFEWLEGGEIGTPSFLDSSFGFVSCEDYHARLFNPGLAGGALLDIGTYNIDISQWILKKNPVEVYADAFLGQSGVDERTSVILKYSDGEASQFTCSLRCNLPNDFTIYGKKGSIRIFP